MKKSKAKGLSPEEARKKVQRDKEKKDREEAQKIQRVTANLEKQRERERKEKMEKENKEKLEVEKEKLEREIVEVAERVIKEKIRLRNIERNRVDNIMEAEIEKAKKEREVLLAEDRAMLQKEAIEREKSYKKRVAELKAEYENLKKAGGSYGKMEEIEKNLDLEDHKYAAGDRIYRTSYEKCIKNRNAELEKKIDDAMKRCNDVYPYSTEPSESETDSENPSGEEDKTMIAAETEQKEVVQDDYEGIRVMKEKIMEIEEKCIPCTSKSNGAVEQIPENNVVEDMEQRQVGLEETDILAELNEIEDCESFVKKALDIQECIVELTTAKDCKKDLGRNLRKEVRSLLEVILAQQRTLISYKAKYEEVSSHRIESEKKQISYADKLKKGIRDKEDSEVGGKQKIKSQYSVSILPTTEEHLGDIKRVITSKIDVSKFKGGIRGVRNIHSGGIVVEVENNDDVKNLILQVSENTELKEKYTASRSQKRLPQIVVYNVDDEVDEDRFKKDLIEKNENIRNEDDFKIRNKYKGRMGNNWIVELLPRAFSGIIKNKKIYIGWQRLDIRENLRPTLCFVCGRPGHIGKTCKNPRVCSRCGGMGHTKTDCKGELCCSNCKFNNEKRGSNYEDKHSCFDKNCPMYKKEIERLAARTLYEGDE